MGNNGRFREEHEAEFTDHDFVAVLQRRLINTLTVHVGAVQTSCVNHKELTVDPAEHGMLTGYGGVVEQNMSSRITTDGDFILVKLVTRT